MYYCTYICIVESKNYMQFISSIKQPKTGDKNIELKQVAANVAANQQFKNTHELVRNILSTTLNLKQNQLLAYLFNLFQTKAQLHNLLDKAVFPELKQQISAWSSNDKAKIIKNLEYYIENSVAMSNCQAQQKDLIKKLQNFGAKFGQQIQKLHTEQAMKNQWLLYTLDFSTEFEGYSFDIDNYEEVNKLVNEVKYLCIRDLTSIFYIASYFVKCCQKLQKNRVKIQVIIEKLQKIGKKLKQQFSVLQGSQKQKHYMKKQDQSSEYDHHTNFQSSYYQPYTFTLTGTVADKQQQLDEQIMNIVQQAKQNHDLFKSIVYSCCIDNNGYNFKSNLKLKSKSDRGPLHRVKQKLFKKQIQKIQSQIPENIKIQLSNCSTIEERRNTQSKFTEGIIDKVLEQASVVPFTVTDILRGKCLFNKVAHINEAVSAIITNLREYQKNNQIQLVQIDNRLKNITRDIVLKIKIGNVVAQFQLVIFFVQAENQIHHKMYELGRSKIKSNVSLLYQWNEGSVKKFLQSVSEYTQGLDGEQKSKIEGKVQKLKQVLGKKQIKLSKQQEQKQYSSIKIDNLLKKFNKKFILDEDQKVYKIINSIKYYYERRQFKNMLRYQNHHRKINSLDAQVFVLIANAYRDINDKINATKFYDLSLTILRQKDHSKKIQAEIFHQRGNLNFRLGNFQEARNLFKQSLKIKQQIKDDPSIDCANSLSNIGMIYFFQNQHDQALYFFNQALQYQQKAKGKHNIGCGFTLNNIGMVYDKQAKYQQSLDFYNEALYIIQTAKGKNSIDCSSILNNIGTVYKNLGKDLQALDYFNQSLKIRQTFKGKDHIDCATSFNNLAGVYKNLGKNEECLTYLQRCLQIRKRVLGIKHKDYALSLNNIGIIYVTMKNFQKGLECLFQSLKIREEGKNIADILVSLQSIGNAYQKQGKLQQALKYYNQALAKAEESKGKNNLIYGEVICNIGSLHEKLQKYQQALNYYKSSIQILEAIKGRNSIDYAQILKFIGCVHKKMNKYEEALNYCSQSQKIIQKIKGKNSITNAQILEIIGQIYQNLGRIDEAEKIYKQSKSITVSL